LRHDVLTAMMLPSQIFWDAKPLRSASNSPRLEVSQSLYLESKEVAENEDTTILLSLEVKRHNKKTFNFQLFNYSSESFILQESRVWRRPSSSEFEHVLTKLNPNHFSFTAHYHLIHNSPYEMPDSQVYHLYIVFICDGAIRFCIKYSAFIEYYTPTNALIVYHILV